MEILHNPIYAILTTTLPGALEYEVIFRSDVTPASRSILYCHTSWGLGIQGKAGVLSLNACGNRQPCPWKQDRGRRKGPSQCDLVRPSAPRDNTTNVRLEGPSTQIWRRKWRGPFEDYYPPLYRASLSFLDLGEGRSRVLYLEWLLGPYALIFGCLARRVLGWV